jgi:uracil-DNA glycosylase family 4
LGSYSSLEELARRVVSCRLCPRLVRFRESVPERASFRGQRYWRRPVPGFGDTRAELVVVGLAPAPHGGNRTGRIFTGDESSRFLVRCLYRAGFANQPRSEGRDDGLEYRGCYVTAAVKCAPPDNRPEPSEFRNCSRYLEAELTLLSSARAVVALGQGAFDAVKRYARSRGANVSGLRFVHGARYELDGMPRLYCCYHPSPRNTYTGKLTEEMMVGLFMRIRREEGIR